MILVLGGTSDARRLARMMAEAEIAGVISMAGVTQAPADQALPVRAGGFGGAEGLRTYLRDHNVRAVIDLTHPFATQMTDRAAQACADTAIPLMRFERPPWQPGDGITWHSLYAPQDAGAVIPPGRVFAAIGPSAAQDFGLAGRDVLCRRVDATVDPAPAGWRWIVARPPFEEAAERELFIREGITALLCKNSGGAEGVAKLRAAADLAIPIYMLERPAGPDLPRVTTLWAALEWVKAQWQV